MNVQKEIKSLLVDLVKIPSVSTDIDQLHKIVDYVENYFSGTNAIIERFEFNKKPSIVIKNFEWKKADIVLNWHLDVVPPSEENQFEPVEKDGKLYARGAGDMKVGDAIIMKLMKDLLNDNFRKKKISLILTTDEEVGGFDGVEKLVKNWYTWDVVLIPDSGSLSRIIYAEKWIIHLTIEFNWVSCHASRPWFGESAVDNMIKFYSLLRNYIQDDKKLYGSKEHWGNSVSLNVVSGWKTTNVIPDKVEAKFDIRFTEEFNLEKLLWQIKKFLLRTNGELKWLLTWGLIYTDPSDFHIQKYLSIAKKYVPEAELSKEHGNSDGRFFAKTWSVVLFHKPTCGNLHWKREYVVLKELEVVYNIYRDFVYS